MDDVCIDSAASRLKQADLYASLSRMGYELENGWSAIVSIRRAGNSAGTKDTYYWSPQGKRFRSKKEVAAFLGLVAGGKVKDFAVLDKTAKRDPDPLYRPFKRHHSERSLQDLSGLSDGTRPWKRKCRSILNAMMAHRYAWPFLCPVKRAEAPGYYDVIKHPMDLSTVMARLDSDVYQCAEEMASDAALIWANAKTYNDPGDGIYQMAEELEVAFDEMWEEKFGHGQEVTGGLPGPFGDPPPLFVGQVAPRPPVPPPARMAATGGAGSSGGEHGGEADSGDEGEGGAACINLLDTLALIAAAEMPSPRAAAAAGGGAGGGFDGGKGAKVEGKEEEGEEEEAEDASMGAGGGETGEGGQQREEREKGQQQQRDEGAEAAAAGGEDVVGETPAAGRRDQGPPGQQREGAAAGKPEEQQQRSSVDQVEGQQREEEEEEGQGRPEPVKQEDAGALSSVASMDIEPQRPVVCAAQQVTRAAADEGVQQQQQQQQQQTAGVAAGGWSVKLEADGPCSGAAAPGAAWPQAAAPPQLQQQPAV